MCYVLLYKFILHLQYIYSKNCKKYTEISNI